MTPALCAPEIVLGLPFDHKIDIWAAGCTMYSLLTRNSLFGFSAELQSDEEAARDEHLLQMTLAIGPLPQRLHKKWHIDKDVVRRAVYPRQGWVHSSIEDSIRKPVSLGLNEQEKEDVLQVLRHMLDYDPTKLYSAERLLQLPWLKDPPGWQRTQEQLRNDYE
jgi:serine/threonine protein kinase